MPQKCFWEQLAPGPKYPSSSPVSLCSAYELGRADIAVPEHFLSPYDYLKLALCASNFSKLMFGSLLEQCSVYKLVLKNVTGRVLCESIEQAKQFKLSFAVQNPHNTREKALGSTPSLQMSTSSLCYHREGNSLTTCICYVPARLIFSLC